MQVYGKKFGWSDVILKAPENCTYTLPDGYEFFARGKRVTYNYTVWEQGLHNTPILSTKRDKWLAISRGNSHAVGIQQPLVSFISSRYADEVNIYTRDNYTVPEKMPTISMCAVYPCERQYKGNVYSGSNIRLRLYKDQQLGPNVNTSDPSLAQVTLVPPNQMEQLCPSSSYSIASDTWNNLNKTLTELLNYYHSIGIPGLNKMTASILGGVDDVDKAMDSMTTSMTDIIRSDTTAFKIPGEPFRDETYIHVRWPWIILPTLSVLFSIFLFISTSIASSRLNVVLWKDSVLPLLMFRLQTDSADDIMSLSKVEEAERISKKIKVVGAKKGSPLVFSEVNN